MLPAAAGFFAALASLLCAVADGFSTGAPSAMCISQQPFHVTTNRYTVIPAMVTSNFLINVNSANWIANGSLIVTLTGSTASDTFGGFVLKAVRASASGTNANLGPLIGSFACNTSSESRAPCRYLSVYAANGENNCVTHSTFSKDIPLQSVTCVWKAPANNEGPIMFSATVVVAYGAYKTQVLSSVIPNAAGVPSVTLPDAQDTMTDRPSTAGCGTAKTCALYPSSCDVSGKCRSGVMMTKLANGSLLFEMFGNTFDWLALGFGDSPMMKSLEVFACVYDSLQKKVVLSYGYAPERFYMPIYRSDITMIKTMIDLGQGDTMSLPVRPNIIYCQFARPADTSYTVYVYNTSIGSSLPITRTSKLSGDGKYVVLAHGKNIPNTPNLAVHVHMPLRSPLQFSANAGPKTMYFNGLSGVVQIHATLMTIFWLLICGFAVIVARHTRPVLTRKFFKKQVWFLIHVVCMVIGYMVAGAGVIYLLVKVGQWKTDFQIHGIIGLIGMGLGLLNILAGIFRPHPGARFRPIFNRLHRWNGLLAYAASIVAMWLGITFDCHTPEFRFWAVVVLGIWICLQAVFMIGFEIARLKVASNKRNELAMDKRFELTDPSGSAQSVPSSADGKSSKPSEEQQSPKVHGKQLVHITDPWIVVYAGTFVALAGAFWAGLWIH